MCGEMRVMRGGAKKVESEGGLLEEGGPVSEGEGGVHRRQARDKVVLERADSTLSLVGAMHMWGSELNVDGCSAEGVMRSGGTSLLKTWREGWKPRRVRRPCRSDITRVHSAVERERMGWARIALHLVM